MRSRPNPSYGFTLVELLVVIAIIGILAGFIAMALPRALEKAKIARLENTFLQMRNALTEYFVTYNSYPPAYGYLDYNATKFVNRALRNAGVEIGVRALTEADINALQTGTPSQQASLLGLSETPDSRLQLVHTAPWIHRIGQYNNRDVYDNFSISYDVDQNDRITRLEFSPIKVPQSGTTDVFNFDRELYTTDNLSLQVDRQLNANELRPLIYIPVNKRQARKVAHRYIQLAEATGGDPRPRNGQFNDVLAEMDFPPPSYDAYVLISVGPTANTAGLPIYDGIPGVNLENYRPAYYYHVLGMITYFMATRDAENSGRGDGELDFDYRGRMRGSQSGSDFYLMPDGSARPGPIIFVGEA